MLEQALLREQCQALLDAERQAEQTYADLVTKIDNLPLREQIVDLLRDKQHHIELTERLLEILD